jgi:hypothetical protein
MFLAADNVMLPGALSRAAQYVAAHPDIDIVYSGIFLMSKSGRIMRRRENELAAAYCGGRDELTALLAFGCDMQIEAMLIPARIWAAHGVTDDRFIAADNEILLRWAQAGVRFAYDPEPFIGYRVHAEQQSSTANYSATGKQLTEHLTFLDEILNSQPDERFRGYEYAIARGLDSKIGIVEKHGFAISRDVHSEIEFQRGRVIEMAYRNATRPRNVRMAVIVLAEESMYALEHSLRSLMAQSDMAWEAFVVQQPGASLQAFCDYIDPLKRITVITMTSETSESMAINTAMMISSANCFTFLRAGNAFTPDHIAILNDAFARSSNYVLCGRTDLIMTDPMLQAYRADNAFPQVVHRNDLLVAPVVPLDAIAISREAIDRTRYFHLDFDAGAHWELLLRVSEYVPLDFVDSTIEMHSILGYDDDIPNSIDLISTTMRLYDRYQVDNEYIGLLRRRYLEDLERAVAFRSARTSSAHERLLSYQIYSGMHALSNAHDILAVGAA